jgi:acetolactate synthase-1/2/3 large subunit
VNHGASDPTPQRLSGARIIVEYLVKQGVPYAVGIPGHGSWTLVDALIDRADAIRSLPVMHEQSAVHLADGYYRVSGRPLLAFTSIGPGATHPPSESAAISRRIYEYVRAHLAHPLAA